jgi:hypothetical protein
MEDKFIAITNLLQTNIINNSIISIDVWSIIHIISGLLIMLLLMKQKRQKPLMILVGLLITWEIFEFTNYQILENTFFEKEAATNVIWDVIVGIGGGTLVKTLFVKK